MHYVIGDIHNDLKKINSILSQIKLTETDELIVLGDAFDRGGSDADPVGVYFKLLGIKGKLTWIRGDHEQWLGNYIKEYYGTSERKRKKIPPYLYNSFDLMTQRLTPVDMCRLADLIEEMPLQKEIKIDGQIYLFAHAMTTPVDIIEKEDYYLTGKNEIESFLSKGVEGAISMCGHTTTVNISQIRGRYLDENKNSVWCNEKGNVFLLDCGCGFSSGKLACMCIETKERFYAD